MKKKPTPASLASVRRLGCPETISWALDSGGTVVVDERRSEVHVLHGLESAVWSWLSLGYSFSDLASFTTELLAIPQEEARRQLTELLDGWMCAGLLETESMPGIQAAQKDSRSSTEEETGCG